MKKTVLFFSLCFAIQASAQAPFTDRDSIDANDINALTLVHGDMWWNPTNPGERSHCKFPAGSNKNLEFAATLWMSGYDAAGQLHVAAQTYRQNGNDYWPGPLDGSGTLNYATSGKWAKIWKVKRSEVNAYHAITFHTVFNTPQSILTWPGANSAYAKGRDGAALSVASDMAPFVDLNNNGIYEPLNGDYPDFNGEQALWWVFSDNGPTHTQSNGMPIKVEVHAMAYAFKRNTLIDKVVYYDYTIINKSPENYHDFRVALWNDVDLNYYLDDFIGFDSTWRMGISYNATNNDGGAAGNPSNSYGNSPPIVGITMVKLPGDVGVSYVPAGSYMYYNNDPSMKGKPIVDTEYNNYMRSKWRNGVHLTNDYTGPGIPSDGYGAGPECNYVYTGDGSLTGGWSECAGNHTPGDRAFVFSSNSFPFNAGSKQRIVMALVVDSIGGGCPHVNFDKIKIVADTAWARFHSLPNSIATENANPGNDILIYPNPAHDKLVIDCSLCHEDGQVSIYNMVGQRVGTSLCKRVSKNTVDISSCPPGVYVVSYPQGGIDKKMMFVKQ